jgi:hypothetical protein
MIEVLRTMRGLWRRFSLYFSIHCMLEYMENILYFPYIPYLVDIVIFSIYGEL